MMPPRFAGSVAVLTLALAWSLPARDAPAPEDTVWAIRPVATALYDHQGRPARDDELLYGQSAIVTGPPDENGRLPVRTEYQYETRLARAGLASDADLPPTWRKIPAYTVTAAFVDVLDAPSIQAYPPRLTLPRGARLRVASMDGDYAKVVLHNDARGYVRTASIRPERAWGEVNETATRKRLVEDAMAYQGAPYRWGGKTPTGIDCSGLASMVYGMNGRAIFRNARAAAGFPIALMQVPRPDEGYTRASLHAEGARPGDLIYWPGHMGLYLGDGRYIHANATDHAVTVNSLVAGDADFREDLAAAGAVTTWGTAFPTQPDTLTVRSMTAVAAPEMPDEAEESGNMSRRYRFFVRVDGFAPTAAVLYPEGTGAGRPRVIVTDRAALEAMTGGAMDASTEAAPVYTFSKPGRYAPTVTLSNGRHRTPNGWTTVTAAPYTMPPLDVR